MKVVKVHGKFGTTIVVFILAVFSKNNICVESYSFSF